MTLAELESAESCSGQEPQLTGVVPAPARNEAWKEEAAAVKRISSDVVFTDIS